MRLLRRSLFDIVVGAAIAAAAAFGSSFILGAGYLLWGRYQEKREAALLLAEIEADRARRAPAELELVTTSVSES